MGTKEHIWVKVEMVFLGKRWLGLWEIVGVGREANREGVGGYEEGPVGSTGGDRGEERGSHGGD